MEPDFKDKVRELPEEVKEMIENKDYVKRANKSLK